MRSARAHRLIAASVPVGGVLYAWSTLATDARTGVAVVVALAATSSSLPSRFAARLVVAFLVWSTVAIALVRTSSASVGELVGQGVADAYSVAPPFVGEQHTELAALVLLFAVAFAVVAAALTCDRPFAAAAVVAAGVGIPATINPSRNTIAMGALALLAVLSPLAVAAMPDGHALGPGVATVAGVTVAAVLLAGIGARPSVAALDWRSWDLFGESHAGRTVALVWSSNYSGIEFPPRKTTVLRITAPRRGLYWRATTLDSFADDRWVEALYATTEGLAGAKLPPDTLLPAAATRARTWVKQEIEVRALIDDHVVAAAQPVAIDTGATSPPRVLSGGVMVKPGGATALRRYTVWSYAPRPTPAELVQSPPSYPDALMRYLDVGRPEVPPFGSPGRDAAVEALFTDTRFFAQRPYRVTWRKAQALTSNARTPFEATIAIERWLRTGGGFTYDERPPLPQGLPPLVDFVERTKRGYCQHFAGTMALMLRYLGIPARVAVGFSSGTWKDDGWTVTDHDAHAWVEVWFAGHGWLPFDPTPGRGTLSATYTNASDSADAIRALGTGRFLGSAAIGRTPTRRGIPATPQEVARGGVNWVGVAPFVLVVAAVLALGALKTVRRRARAAVRDPRGRASAARAELAAFLCDQGAPVTISAPVSTLAVELRSLGVGSDAFARAFARARYGPPAIAAAAADETRAELGKVISVLRNRLGLGRRLRGFFALRSLRGG